MACKSKQNTVNGNDTPVQPIFSFNSQPEPFSLSSAKGKPSGRRRWNVGGNAVKDSIDDMLDDVDFSFAKPKPVNHNLANQNKSPTKFPTNQRKKSIFDDDFDDDDFLT